MVSKRRLLIVLTLGDQHLLIKNRQAVPRRLDSLSLLCEDTTQALEDFNPDATSHTVDYMGFVPLYFDGNVTKFAPHKALNSIA